MKKRIIIITIIAIFLIVTVVNLFGRDRTNAQIVRITEAEMGDIQSWLSTNALIQSSDVKTILEPPVLK